MNNQKRRPFRPRPNKNSYRGRSNGARQNNNGHFQGNGGNNNFSRNNGSMTNPFNVEKTIQKYHQLAKDAQTNGDPVLAQNYLQHADHYLRRYNELNERKENSLDKTKTEEKSLPQESISDNKNLQKTTS